MQRYIENNKKINKLFICYMPIMAFVLFVVINLINASIENDNTFLNKSEHWVYLDSHEKYKGRDFFFPDNIKDASDRYILKILPEE